MNFRTGLARRDPARVELTPLIDVVFLLLIFFLITTTFVQEKHPNLPIELPAAASSVKTQETKHITVHINSEGTMFVGDEVVEAAGLKERFERLHASDAGASVLLRADATSTHGAVVRVMDLARSAGLKRFGVVSRKP